MYCPNCKAEFVKGVYHCPDCDVDLVEKLPEESKEKQVVDPEESYEVVSLMTSHDKVQTDLIMNMLKNNGISCFKKAKTAGGYLELYAGDSIYGEDIFVHKSNYAKAYTLCNEIMQEDEAIQEEDEQFEQDVAKMQERKHLYNRTVTITCRVILIVAIAFTLITWVTDLFF